MDWETFIFGRMFRFYLDEPGGGRLQRVDSCLSKCFWLWYGEMVSRPRSGLELRWSSGVDLPLPGSMEPSFPLVEKEHSGRLVAVSFDT